MEKPGTPLRDAIISSTIQLLGNRGLTGCSIENVSRAAECAKGLVNYHFGSKRRLLDSVALQLRDRRSQSRSASLSAGLGTRALDALWDTLLREVREGEARAWFALASDDPRLLSLEAQTGLELVRLATRALDLSDDAIPSLLLLATLDGLQLSLLSGTPPHEVRESFDRFWLLLLLAESEQHK
jgi:AcrR family transcriptional regulator